MATRIRALQDTGHAFVAFLEDQLTVRRKRILTALIAYFDVAFTQSLASAHQTLIHRDAHHWNFLYPQSAAGTIKLVDWEDFGRGMATDDLAYMMPVHWYPELRRAREGELLRSYHEALLRHGVHGYTLDRLLLDYRRSVLRAIAIPVVQWQRKMPAFVWFHHFERILLAYDDLQCAELLTREDRAL